MFSNLKILNLTRKLIIRKKFLLTWQAKAMKAYLDPNPPAVAPTDPHVADAAAEQTRFDQDTACWLEIIRSAQEARPVQITRQFIESLPGWLRATLLEQPEDTTVEDFCIFAQKQLSIHNFCKQTILPWTRLAKRDLRLPIHLLPLRQN